MYDTVGTLLQVGSGIADADCWQRVKSSLNPKTGELHIRHEFNEPGRPQLTLHDRLTLRVERSLPKALHGTNTRDLAQVDLPDALAVVDREVAELLHVELPPLATWQPYRVDYCRNDQLADELEVRRHIRQAREVVVARKGRPVAGQSGTSLAWPSRSIGFKMYGKHAESGEPGTEGMLRLEAGVRHLATFRRELELPSSAVIELRDVLKPEVWESILARFADVRERFPMTEAELTDRRFVEAFLECFPISRVATLVGFSMLYQLAGAPTAAQVARGDRSIFGYSRPSVYRHLADLRKFRLYLVEKGYVHQLTRADETYNRQEVGLDELREVIDRLASLRQYLPNPDAQVA